VVLRLGLGTGEISGTILAIIGSVLIVLHGDIAELSSLKFGLGDIFIVLSMLCWAIYTVCLKWKPDGLNPLGFIFVLAGLSVPMLLPFYVWELHHADLRPVRGQYRPDTVFLNFCVRDRLSFLEPQR
jgi:drug/metabolite transporter (DMT)-like permease